MTEPDPTQAAGRVFTPLGGETVYEGRIVDVRVERFRYPDGAEVSREIVRHRGAVAIVAIDESTVWLVRQPREAVGESSLLEIPAGRLDVDGEEPLQAAQRELAEEIGLGARRWEPILAYYTGAGFTDERVHLFLASGLYESHADSGEDERIEIVRWPLEKLTEAIASCTDAKTLIGLMWLHMSLNGELQTQGAGGKGAKLEQ
jgi:8-oxo-dGTP pyrophosphatase MutT (NUDIX family)